MGAVDVVPSLPAFVLAVLLISASPGPAMALIVRRAALRGLPAAVPTVLGLELGLYVWALVAGAGFAALVAASEVGYLVLRVVGAAVLLVLGVRAWRAAWRDAGEVVAAPVRPTRRGWGAGVGGRGGGAAGPRRAGLAGRLAGRRGGGRGAGPADEAGLVDGLRRGAGRAAGQPEGRRVHDRLLPTVRARRGAGVRDDRAAGPPADHAGDGALPRPGRRRRQGGRLVPPAADPPSAGGGQRHGARGPRRPGGRLQPLSGVSRWSWSG